MTAGEFFDTAMLSTAQRGQCKRALKLLARRERRLADWAAAQVAYDAGLINRATYQARRRQTKPQSLRDIAVACGLAPSTVAKVQARPELFHPLVDRIAIRRALAGDPSVLPSMTVFERRALRRKIQALHYTPAPDGTSADSMVGWLERELGLPGLVDAVNKAAERDGKVQVQREEAA